MDEEALQREQLDQFAEIVPSRLWDPDDSRGGFLSNVSPTESQHQVLIIFHQPCAQFLSSDMRDSFFSLTVLLPLYFCILSVCPN